MTTLTEYKFKTEVLGHTIRVIDEEGNDVIVIGSVQNPENIALANLFAAAPELLNELKIAERCIESLSNQLEKYHTPCWQYQGTLKEIQNTIDKAEGRINNE